VPLLSAVRRKRPVTAAAAGFAFGLGFYAALLYWIAIFGYLPWILLAVLEALPIAAFGALAALVYQGRRAWLELAAIPALWTALDWARTLGTYGFTWGGLAYSQAPNTPAIQIAALTGPWGLTFGIALFNAALTAERRKAALVTVALIVAAAIHLGGWLALKQPEADGRTILVALAQGSLDQDVNMTPQRATETMRVYTELTRTAADKSPEFVVWPETVVPGDLAVTGPMRNWVASLARSSGTHLLCGSLRDRPARGSLPATQMNGAFMFGPDGKLLGSYYKVHLVPFGEFVPLRRWLPFIERYRVRPVDVRPGKEHNLIPTSFGQTGVMICFESIFPYIAREETRKGAKLLVVITNDGWFKRTAGAAQHHDFAILRAVENRRYVVHNGATGISSVIDPYGRVQDRLGIWERGVLYGDVRMRSGATWYARFGDWFAWLSAAVGAVGIMVGGIRRKEKKHRKGRRR